MVQSWADLKTLSLTPLTLGLGIFSHPINLEKLRPLRNPFLPECSFCMFSTAEVLWDSWTFIWWLRASQANIPIERAWQKLCHLLWPVLKCHTQSLRPRFFSWNNQEKKNPPRFTGREINSPSWGGSPRIWICMWTGKKNVWPFFGKYNLSYHLHARNFVFTSRAKMGKTDWRRETSNMWFTT